MVWHKQQLNTYLYIPVDISIDLKIPQKVPCAKSAPQTKKYERSDDFGLYLLVERTIFIGKKKKKKQ